LFSLILASLHYFFLSAILPQCTVAEVILPPISQYHCRLFEECFEKGLYRTATCYILVIEKLEGSSISQHSALRLLKATLEVSMYELAGELVRFLLRCGREGEFAEKEADRYSNSLFSSFFLGLTPR
jgi:hypothetical protein